MVEGGANFPNPFNPETWIPFTLNAEADVTITIFDTRGTVVRTLSLGQVEPGAYTSSDVAAHWDGRNAIGEPAASGVYVYEIRAGDDTVTRKMLLAK